jgi:alpha-L-fucosidase
VPIFEERLRQLGSWLKLNGEAIYSTRPWKYQNDTTNSDVWYTTNGNIVYAILLNYPTNSLTVVLSSPRASDVFFLFIKIITN